MNVSAVQKQKDYELLTNIQHILFTFYQNINGEICEIYESFVVFLSWLINKIISLQWNMLYFVIKCIQSCKFIQCAFY